MNKDPVLQCHPDIVFGDIPRYYAWDYRVLRRFAKHYLTGEIIPEKLVKSMQGARDMFAATELQRQVIVEAKILSIIVAYCV